MNSESFPMNMKIREFTLNIIFVISIFSVYFRIFHIHIKIPRIRPTYDFCDFEIQLEIGNPRKSYLGQFIPTEKSQNPSEL